MRPLIRFFCGLGVRSESVGYAALAVPRLFGRVSSGRFSGAPPVQCVTCR